MKRLLLTGSLFVLCTSLYGQGTLPKHSTAHEIEYCSQHHKMAEMQQNDPERFASIMSGPVGHQDDHYQTGTTKTTGLIYTIPVVFHILHNNGSENISDAQIEDQLAILNRDFRRLNADANQVVSAFSTMPSDAEIEFVFATVAPNGNCFSGITRTVTTLTNDGSSGQNQVNAVVAGNDVYQGVWAHNKYLNIYVAADIGGAAGYTFNPNGGSTANATNMYYNGIFLLHDYCGSIGTSSAYTSRSLTHEVGHWLNLAHVWGSTNNPGVDCTGTDNVNDTPATKGSNLACNLSANTCTTDNAYWGFNQIDNVENYMDYSYCSKMYTQGQVDRMRTALTSSTGGRNNIWTTTNLNLVGGGPGTSLCAIDFDASQTTMCAGTTVTYTPNTTSGISAYSWSFPGGTPSTSTATSPTVTYSTPGTYNASLTVTSSSNGNTYPKSKTNYITVNANSTVSLPISEGFTSTTFPPTNWSIYNPNSSTTWVRSASVGNAPTAGNSAKFDNYNVNDATDDELRLPKADMLNYTSAQLTFHVAYAPYDATWYDGLEVLVSTDCGGTFTSVFQKVNTVLATASATTASFVPTAAQWRTETIDMTPYVGNSSVWVVFRNLAGNGNNLYIDNINLTGVAGTPTAPTASFSASGTAVCAGQSITFTSTSTGNPTSYDWSFPGGTPSSSTQQNPTITYSTPGTYNVSLTATNSGGSNTSTQNNYVTVNAVPSAPTITPGGPTTFCQGGSVTLTSSVASGNTWSNGGATSNSITVSTSGTYTVTQTASGCTSPASSSVTVTVNSNPTVTFGSVGQLCVYDSPVTLTQGSPSGGTYSGTGVSGNQFNPATAGLGTWPVTYNYTNGNGCSGSAQTSVVVDDCAAIDENAVNPVLIYPNPSNGILKIDAGTNLLEQIEVFNNMGQLVYVLDGEQSTHQEINLMNVASGVYTVRVQTDLGTQHVAVMIDKK